VILERAGYEVFDAADAAQGRLALQNRPATALLLTDIVMPGQNGLWLAAQAHLLQPALPVVFMSGFAENYQDELTGSVCLRKPFTRTQLLSAVQDALGSRRTASG
jgi:DNA-binding NtrC family response regulator